MHARVDPEAQRVLAREVTRLVHGDGGLSAPSALPRRSFSGDPEALGEADLQQLALDGLPSDWLMRGDFPPTFSQLLAQVGVAAGKQVKDALAREAVWVNGQAVSGGPTTTCDAAFDAANALHGRYFSRALR